MPSRRRPKALALAKEAVGLVANDPTMTAVVGPAKFSLDGPQKLRLREMYRGSGGFSESGLGKGGAFMAGLHGLGLVVRVGAGDWELTPKGRRIADRIPPIVTLTVWQRGRETVIYPRSEEHGRKLLAQYEAQGVVASLSVV